VGALEAVVAGSITTRASSGQTAAGRSVGSQGILFVLHTGIGWEHLPQEFGFGSGMTAWRRLRSWHQPGVWKRLHQALVARLQAAGEIV
jgi:transposase